MNAHVSYQVEPVVRKDLDFHLNEAPRFWFNNDPFLTRMFDALSLTFPDGERYFIECVRIVPRQNLMTLNYKNELRILLNKKLNTVLHMTK